MPASSIARAFLALAACTLAFPFSAGASFHFMQIEQVRAGVCGRSDVQAIQLRMRFAGQSLLGGARLRSADASGGAPVTVVDFGSSVTNSGAGSRVLVGSQRFQDLTGIADVVMSTPIPAARLRAGRLTFESDGGVVYWSLAWGGASYTGSHAGDTTNDADGDFGPAFGGPLPSTSELALLFRGTTAAQSTGNLFDYALTDVAAVFTNNFGQLVLLDADCLFGDDFELGSTGLWSANVP